jgi:hypothetical protein
MEQRRMSYTINKDRTAITCHQCGRTSYNFNDVARLYCGVCHRFHEDTSGIIKAYLIDPEARTVRTIDLPDLKMLDAMRRILGGNMDHQTISDMHDTLWVEEFGLKRGEPIHAFKLPAIQPTPYAGKAIIIGADDEGRTRAPYIPIEILMRDVEWLGVIVPAVDWVVTDERGAHAVVTYSRPNKNA